MSHSSPGVGRASPAAGVLLVDMFDVSALTDIARTADAGRLAVLGSDLLHLAVGLMVLLAV